MDTTLFKYIVVLEVLDVVLVVYHVQHTFKYMLLEVLDDVLEVYILSNICCVGGIICCVGGLPYTTYLQTLCLCWI